MHGFPKGFQGFCTFRESLPGTRENPTWHAPATARNTNVLQWFSALSPEGLIFMCVSAKSLCVSGARNSMCVTYGFPWFLQGFSMVSEGPAGPDAGVLRGPAEGAGTLRGNQ